VALVICRRWGSILRGTSRLLAWTVWFRRLPRETASEGTRSASDLWRKTATESRSAERSVRS